MTDEEILTKIFKKVSEKYKVTLPEQMGQTMPMDKVIEFGVHYKILFDHQFAKALWGDIFLDNAGKEKVFTLKGKRKLSISGFDVSPAYIYHLKQMVMLPNPIKYLEQFV